MARQIEQTIVTEYPEAVELNELLNMAEITWSRWGLSVDRLAEQSPYVRGLLKILIDR